MNIQKRLDLKRDFTSNYNNTKLRLFRVDINDPIKFYLYKAELWKDNNEGFDFFKKIWKILLKIIEIYKNKIKSPSLDDIIEKKTIENEKIDEADIQIQETVEEGKKTNKTINYEIEEDLDEFKAKEYIGNEKCQNVLETYKNEKITIDHPEYRKFKMCQETVNSEKLANENISGIYPSLDDPNFVKKISLKREFFETKYDTVKQEDIENIEKKVDELCGKKTFQLSPHQMFIRNFMSSNTPYKSLLLYHGLGTGKTCSSILVTENMRVYLKKLNIKKKIFIVASPVVQENYKIQLFDEKKLKKVGGKWDIKSCTAKSLIKDVNPIGDNISRDRLVKNVNKLIKSSYSFMGYNKFSNYITNIMNRYGIGKNDDEKTRAKKIKLIKNEFSNRLIVIDEVQNIRNVKEENKIKESSNNFLELVKYADNLKLILLTATPMFNDPQEIVWLLNLMNINDNRVPINVSDVFDKDGELLIGNMGEEIGKELLERKMRGYISYVRGENPMTFPNAIYPNDYDNTESLIYLKNSGDWEYPKLQMNDREINEPIKYLDITAISIENYQEQAYNYIIQRIKNKHPVLAEKRKGIQYTIIDGAIQSLNMIYPDIELEPAIKSNSLSYDYKSLYGKSGLSRVMEHNNGMKGGFEYKPETISQYGRIFNIDNIGNYSCKMKSILDSVINSEGIIIIYSQYIYGGCIPIALALEELYFQDMVKVLYLKNDKHHK